jgi:predicted ester cyclase
MTQGLTMHRHTHRRPHLLLAGLLALSGTAAATSSTGPAQAELARIHATEAQQQKNLATFDDLDFNVYIHQKWDELGRSHAANILVHYPDGHTTRGLADHIAALKPMFVFAPDNHIDQHPMRIAQGELTAVLGVLQGHFSQPMPTGNGQTLPPTSKAFTLSTTTIGRWEHGVMVEEWLFWDNQAFMQQIGLAR